GELKADTAAGTDLQDTAADGSWEGRIDDPQLIHLRGQRRRDSFQDKQPALILRTPDGGTLHTWRAVRSGPEDSDARAGEPVTRGRGDEGVLQRFLFFLKLLGLIAVNHHLAQSVGLLLVELVGACSGLAVDFCDTLEE